MKFAVSEGKRIEATPGAKGVCPGCSAEMLARCGTRKVWHWAHRGQRHCDHWWENETQWHRDWKNHFPTDWQEIAARDDEGELHIADIKTPHGWVVEFQHSYIKPEEAHKRTQFHNPMFWVVDGVRRDTDLPQFIEALKHARLHGTQEDLVYQVRLSNSRLLREWAPVGVFVAFDFGLDDVWILRRVHEGFVLGFFYSKEKLVTHISEGSGFPDIQYSKPQQRKVRIPVGRSSRRIGRRF